MDVDWHTQAWDFLELCFVYFFYVETKGPTLEEVARIFDGMDAVANINIRQVEKEIQHAEHEEYIHDDRPYPGAF